MANALFVHINDTNHAINWTESKEILYCTDYIKRNLIESSIIKKEYDKLLNISHGLYKIDDILINGILRQIRY